MKMEYRFNANGLTCENLVDLWHNVGWSGESANYDEQLLSAMQKSDFIITVWNESGVLVGLVACMTNTMQVYISQLCVRIGYQKSGIGSKLLEFVKKHYAGCQIILITENARSFYQKSGFNFYPEYSAMEWDNRGMLSDV